MGGLAEGQAVCIADGDAVPTDHLYVALADDKELDIIAHFELMFGVVGEEARPAFSDALLGSDVRIEDADTYGVIVY